MDAEHSEYDQIFAGVKVLVVDDLVPNRMLFKHFFKILGCEGDFAENGAQAVAKMRNNRYDLCLMDLQMPEMNGIEATRVIREELKNPIPIIALTGSATEVELKQGLAAGMNDSCVKPIKIECLVRVMKKYAKENILPQGPG